jgi:hypothetical protein
VVVSSQAQNGHLTLSVADDGMASLPHNRSGSWRGSTRGRRDHDTDRPGPGSGWSFVNWRWKPREGRSGSRTRQAWARVFALACRPGKMASARRGGRKAIIATAGRTGG